MNKTIYLTNKLIINNNQFIKQMHIGSQSIMTKRCQELIDQARQLAYPQAAIKKVEVKKRHEKLMLDNIYFDGHFFNAIENGQQIFVFLATCGNQIAEWVNQQTTLIERFWADKLAEVALYSAFDTAEQYLTEHYQFRFLKHICPGATPAWPLEGQRDLFVLMAAEAAKLQTTLTDNFFMQPDKSLSGIFFASKDDMLIDCGYCQHDNCDKKHCPYKVVCF